MAPLKDISRVFGQQSPSAEPISRTMQYRKITKPLLERQRRARINRCLDELKDILVVGLQSEGENVARLEKADILELTVRHLHKLTLETSQNVKSGGQAVGDDEKFRSGFAAAVREISRVLASTPKIDVHVGSNLMIHLGHALNQMSSPCQAIDMSSPARQSSPPSPVCSSRGEYRPYTPPASPQSSEVSSTGHTGPMSPRGKNVWRPWSVL